MFHRSERLLLRPPWPEDWEKVLGGIADQGIVRNLARAPWPYREKDAREFVQLPIADRYPRFLVTRARDAALIGCVGIDPAEDGATELGYWIARPYWGQGFAIEAAAAALEIARLLGHTQVRAGHFLDNPASGRVLAKIGMEPTGRVVERHSCARGEDVPMVEYALDFESAESRVEVAA